MLDHTQPFLRRCQSIQATFSTASATPCPPPIHRVASPFCFFDLFISYNKVTNTRAPEAPIGCPRLIAPPLTFTFSGSRPSCALTASACAANASLASTKSRSSILHPAFLRHFLVAGTGPMPMILGSTPALEYPAILASIGNPFADAKSSEVTNSAAAPSLIPEALAAVTVPSFLNAPLSLLSPAAVTPALGNSSVSKITGSPLR
mmetsp:Transcript_9933/g.12392  ORF Transcript_9933/g.12392 Transcript_9933/m.12392 type:complete len:205 (+) Transcript_9933:1680-2294(+)